MKFIARIVLPLFLLCFVGCEHSRLAFSGAPSTPYHKTLQSQTQYQKLFGLEKVLYETYVTYNSPKLAEEYVKEYTKIFSLSDEKAAAMLSETRANQEKYDEFLIAHYASEIDNRTLTETRPDNVVWKFFLQTPEGTLIEPVEISQVTMGTQRNHFYPYLDGWNRMFRIRFTKTASQSKELLMKGTIRELKFNWKE